MLHSEIHENLINLFELAQDTYNDLSLCLPPTKQDLLKKDWIDFENFFYHALQSPELWKTIPDRVETLSDIFQDQLQKAKERLSYTHKAYVTYRKTALQGMDFP